MLIRKTSLFWSRVLNLGSSNNESIGWENGALVSEGEELRGNGVNFSDKQPEHNKECETGLELGSFNTQLCSVRLLS